MSTKKRDLSAININNADEICSEIKKESIEEEALLLGKAVKEKESVLSEAARQSRIQSDAILIAADTEISRIKERIFSIVTMEKKRASLEGKSLFVEDVISAVKKESEDFRANKDYAKFLKDAMIEGIKIVDDQKAQVYYSYLDEGIINTVKPSGVEFKKGDFKDLGVIVQSQDGRLLFDNRFSARLKRAYDEIYMKLIKEVF